ncbi:MAG: ferrous iron transport protein B [Clostridia bacterium]|nr:ferrous iron transport protein B [Clostridia bacterium]MDD4798790.1 ferrous iron transport protein B [Clostridia bacterium]
MKLNIALTGNPNSGKTLLFNEITGEDQSIGNWPGVTVEIATKQIIYKEHQITMADLPGIYSLVPHSPEQTMACDFIIGKNGVPPEIIIDVVDVTNLERSLYLSTQLISTGLPIVLALNMYDELEASNFAIDIDELSSQLGVPCVPISAAKRKGLAELLDVALDLHHWKLETNAGNIWRRFSPDLMAELEMVAHQIKPNDGPDYLDRRWLAQQILEEHDYWHDVTPTVKGDKWEAAFGSERYRIVAEINAVVFHRQSQFIRQRLSRKIDALTCHRVLALPIFLCVMAIIFFFSFGPPGQFVTAPFDYLLHSILPAFFQKGLTAAPAWLSGLFLDGIWAGVAGILVFLPQLIILFFFLALLEDSGYMARAAFIMDRLLKSFGLAGTSFIPMILGFGCSVPAILACRNMENIKQRKLTILAVPFMSCSARLPIYAMFAASVFAAHQGTVIFSLYILGMIFGLLTALFFSKFVYKGGKGVFVMEIPPYRRPIWHCIWRRLWLRIWDFIARACPVLIVASVGIWFFSNYSFALQPTATSGEENMLQGFGKLIAPLLTPLGFGDWKAAVALMIGFLRKEAVVSTLAILYGGGGELALSSILSTVFSPAAAYSFLVFALLYTPCVATVAVMRKEGGSWRFALMSIAYQLAVAWGVAFVAYQLLSLVL